MKLYTTLGPKNSPVPVFPQGDNINVLIIVALILTIATGRGVEHYNAGLVTDAAPWKIVSLELAWHHDTAVGVVDSWKSKLHEVRMSIYVDFFFILAYGFGLFVLVKKTAEAVANDDTSLVWPIWTKVACVAPIVAMAGDAIENISMLAFIANHNVPVGLFSWPAAIKFGAIVYVLAYCLYASRIFQNVLKACKLYAPGLIAVIVSFVLFSKLTQGQDVVIQISEYSGPKWWTMLTTLLWVWFTWYSARLVTYTRMQEYGNTLPEFYHVHPPRLLAFNALVSIQTAIVSLPSLKVIDPKMLVSFVVFQNVVYFAWSYLIRRKKWNGWKGLSAFVVVAFSGFYITMVALAWNRIVLQTHDQKYLLFFALALFVISLFFIWLWFRRSRNFDEQEWKFQPAASSTPELTYLTIFGWRILPVLPHRKEEEQPWFLAFNIAAAIALLLYAGSFFSLWLADRLGPLAFATLAFGILVGFANIISIVSINYKTNYFAVLFVIAIVVGLVYNPYKVRVVEGESAPARPTLAQYFDQWMTLHKDRIQQELSLHPQDPAWRYPVYLVIADGGASRSGYWVASVLSALQDSSIRRNQLNATDYPTIFSDHLLGLAGASGGSVGNATFFALLQDNIKKGGQHVPDYLERSRNLLKNDFLTPALTHWFGSDLVQHVVPMPFLDDRAGALERVIENFGRDSASLDLTRPFDEVIQSDGELPMLFINTTSVRKGKPAVVSSVALDSTICSRIDVVGTLKGKSMMRYSTAFILGARFPYVSPAGQLLEENYVDGGYFDNTGAGIVHEALQYLIPKMKALARTDTARANLYNRIQFRVLYISNSPLKTSPVTSIHPLSNDLASPILTVLGTYSSQTDVNNLRLESFLRQADYCGKMTPINLYQTPEDPDLPMNWVISNYNLSKMNRRLEHVKRTDLLPLLNY